MAQGTRKQRADTLFLRLARGPEFANLPGQAYTAEEAKKAFRLWSESWILTDLCKLVPELKDKLNNHGYVDPEIVNASQKPMP
jgi:hypothetical protein